MMISCRLLSCFVAISLLAACAGCGSRRNTGRPDIDAIPEIELRGAATKASLYEFKAKVQKRGVNAAKQDLPDLLENIRAHEKLNLGAHNATYKELAEKLAALQGELGSSPSKDALVKKIDEICTVAEKLPGTANKEPTVE